jgi:hypothetical protein
VRPAVLRRLRRRRGRVPDGACDERAAIVDAAQLVNTHVTEPAEADRIEQERRARGATFREVAHGYLHWLKDVRGAKRPRLCPTVTDGERTTRPREITRTQR